MLFVSPGFQRTASDDRFWHKAEVPVGSSIGLLLTDAVDKVGGVTGLAALAAAGLSWVVLVFFAPPGAPTYATERHWDWNSRN
jgi:hypothetical protein